MAKRTPTPVRFDEAVAARLTDFAAAHLGLSLSGAANLLVGEALRMIDHPGVVFRDGPSGRRAGLVDGPDVWEVVRAIRSARSEMPARSELPADPATTDLGPGAVGRVAANAGLPAAKVHVAVAYWAAYPNEIDASVQAAERAEVAAVEAWERERGLLAG